MDNPFFPEVLRREMEWDRARDQETYDHIWGGDYEKHAEARVFKNWKVVEFETPDDVVLRFGGDWGYAVDPTVLIRCYLVGEKTLRIDHEAYQVGCEIDQTPELFRSVPGAEAWTITADSARPETISYLQRHGFPRMKAAKKGPDSVKEGIIFLQGYDIEVHPRCTRTIQELKRYAYKKDHLTGQVTPVLLDKENHVIDSLRYAVEDLRQPVEFCTW
jgi:phage terminase large subunit